MSTFGRINCFGATTGGMESGVFASSRGISLTDSFTNGFCGTMIFSVTWGRDGCSVDGCMGPAGAVGRAVGAAGAEGATRVGGGVGRGRVDNGDVGCGAE